MPSRDHFVSLTTQESGLELSSSREKRGISLQQVVEETKICMRYLRAIEREEFGELPGGVFTLSYLRQYAEASGFDPERLLKHYAEYVTPAEKEAPEVVERCESRSFFGRLFRPAV